MRFDFNSWDIVRRKILHSLATHIIFFGFVLLFGNSETTQQDKIKPAIVFDFNKTQSGSQYGSVAAKHQLSQISFAFDNTNKTIDGDSTKATNEHGKGFDPFRVVQTAQNAFSALRAYGMLLESVRSYGGDTTDTTITVDYDYEIDDFYQSVAENWHKSRPITSMKYDLLLEVRFETEANIVVKITECIDNKYHDCDTFDRSVQRVFKERAVNAVYSAYQHKQYSIPVGTMLRFRFLAP